MKKSYNKFLKKIAHFQVDHPFFTVLILLMVTLGLYGGVSQVKTVASLEKMMPSTIDEIKAFNTLRDNHMGQDIIAIVIEIDRDNPFQNPIDDITNKTVYDYIAQMQTLMENEPDVLKTYSYTNFLYSGANMLRQNFLSGNIDSSITNFIEANKMSPIDMENAFEEISFKNKLDFALSLPDNFYYSMLNFPDLQNRISGYVSSDSTTTMILATTDVSADDDRMNLLSTKIKNLYEYYGHPPGIKISFTGTPVVQQKLGELISRDRTYTQNISTLLVFIITFLIFGSLASALVPIIIVTLSVNWLYGIMGYNNLPISTLAGGVAAMVIGIGIDYSIHLINKFKNMRKEGNGIRESIEIAVSNTGTALTGAALATVAAFLAFLFGKMPEMNRFGLLMAIGVSSAFILAIFGLPALLIIEEKVIHFLSRKLKFGVDGEFVLYDKSEIHPEDYEVICPHEDDLKTILKDYKIVIHKNHPKLKKLKKGESK